MKVKHLHIVLFTINFLLIGYSCNDNNPVEPIHPYIVGQVHFTDASPASNMEIKILQADTSVFTDEYGVFVYEAPTCDTCNLVVGSFGYVPESRVVHEANISQINLGNIVLESIPCTPRDSLPDGHSIGVTFTSNDAFVEIKYETNIGDLLYIKAWEEGCSYTDYSAEMFYIWVITSIGDSEFRDYDYLPGGIFEIWRYGYVMDTKVSIVPIHDNGIVEVGSDGGWIIALYLSVCLDVYVCHSHQLAVP